MKTQDKLNHATLRPEERVTLVTLPRAHAKYVVAIDGVETYTFHQATTAEAFRQLEITRLKIQGRDPI